MPWYTIAEKELGQKEIPGNKDNPRIQEYLKEGGLPNYHDETPWCASFVNWCLNQIGIKGTGKANARSFENWGNPTKEYVKGAIVVLSRTSDPSLGHVGFLADWDSTSITLLGGNQSDKVCYSKFPKTRIVSMRVI